MVLNCNHPKGCKKTVTKVYSINIDSNLCTDCFNRECKTGEL